VHTIGQQKESKNVLWTTTYSVEETFELEEEMTRKFTFNSRVKLMAIGTRPEDDLYDVYITYFDLSDETVVGRVIYTNLLDASSVKMFDFTPSLNNYLGNPISERIFHMEFDEDNYLYAGHSNFLPEDIETSSLQIDWTQNEWHYGFFNVYTNDDRCLTQSERDDLDYGEHLAVDFDGTQE